MTDIKFYVPAFIAGVVFCALLIGFINLIGKNRNYKQLNPKSKDSQPEDNDLMKLLPEDYAHILQNVELGILVFNHNKDLIYSNLEFYQSLGFNDLNFTNLDEFLTTFGSENGIMAGYLLGNRNLSATYNLEDKVALIELHEFSSENNNVFTSVTFYDITQRENLEKQRKLFVANVSHELKTPLTTIISYTDSLLDWGLEEYSKEQLTKDITRIHEDGIRMQKLVNNLALLTALDSRGVRPQMDELDINHLVKFCVDRLQFKAKEKDIELVCDNYVPNLPLVYGERTSIERILNNLIENAIKYTPKSGHINVYINYIRDEIYIKVQDNGIGMTKDDLALIFNRFYRVDNSGSSVLGGTGLGLSIAKELAEMHNGRIQVTSRIGLGSEFIFFIPSAEKIMSNVLLHRHSKHKLSIIEESACQFLLNAAKTKGIAINDLSALSDQDAQELLEPFKSEPKVDSEKAETDLKGMRQEIEEGVNRE